MVVNLFYTPEHNGESEERVGALLNEKALFVAYEFMVSKGWSPPGPLYTLLTILSRKKFSLAVVMRLLLMI